jgi:hypothetical protein
VKTRRHINFILLGIGIALLVWVSLVRPRNGEVQEISQTPWIGKHLASLTSIQPVLYHARFDLSGKYSALVFRGMAQEKTIQSFALEHGLARITNEIARTRLLSKLVDWKLDLQRFPIFNGPHDLCYAGKLDPDGHFQIQLCHQPGDDRFTGLVIATEANTAAPPQN